MTVIDEVRQLLQDIVTPDLKVLAVRVSALESQMLALRQEMRLGFQAQDLSMERLISALRLDERVKRLEEHQAQQQPPSPA